MQLRDIAEQGKRYRAEISDGDDEFFSVLNASTKNMEEFGEDEDILSVIDAGIAIENLQDSREQALSSFEKITRDLGTVYNALVNEGFHWTFSHIETKNEILRIRESLLSAGMNNYLILFDESYKLYCTYSPNYNNDPAYNMSGEDAYSKLQRIEAKMFRDKEGDKFLSIANEYCRNRYDWAQND